MKWIEGQRTQDQYLLEKEIQRMNSINKKEDRLERVRQVKTNNSINFLNNPCREDLKMRV